MVRAMTAAMAHRGPDGEGFLLGDARVPDLALGMRRLSIIDLPGGQQPIWNESRNIAVIFNGEIYNYQELRERLGVAGHRFTTRSDTEMLVHGWEEWGEDLLSELRGMFAFALLDLRKQFAAVLHQQTLRSDSGGDDYVEANAGVLPSQVFHERERLLLAGEPVCFEKFRVVFRVGRLELSPDTAIENHI